MSDEKKYIKAIHVRKLWGIKNIDVELHDDINIFIGDNGSGKTTLLRLLESILTLDWEVLKEIDFESVEIQVLSSKLHSIIVHKTTEDNIYPVLTFKIDKKTFSKIHVNEPRIMRRMMHSYDSSLDMIEEQLQSIINISWLSIARNEENPEKQVLYGDYKNDVNEKLSQLMGQLVAYRLQLETEISRLTKKLNEDAFSLFLYNKEFDSFYPGLLREDIDTDILKSSLFQIFGYYGNADDHKNDINEHISKIDDVIKKIKINTDHPGLLANDAILLSLAARTGKLADISKEYQESKANVLDLINKYKQCLEEFMKDKDFDFSEKSGELIVRLKNQLKRKIPLQSLSSGEKQLLILLTETLVHQNTSFAFIADEPELSLHIEWQRKLLSSINDLNSNVQIIVATHSPEIAGNFRKKIINMEDITSYE